MKAYGVTTTSAERPRPRPDFAFMRARLSRWIAFGLGSGLSAAAPGTVGTLLAWLVWAVLLSTLEPQVQVACVALSFAVGVWACGRAGDDLGVPDHSAIVWDEIAAFWLVLLVVPGGFGSQFAAFALFRLFDITKPPPIRDIDARLKTGFGVMLDDLVAALFTIVALLVLRWMFS